MGLDSVQKWKLSSIMIIAVLAVSTGSVGLYTYNNNSRLEQLERNQQQLLHEQDTSFAGFDEQAINLPSVLPAAYGAGTLTNVRVSNTNNLFGSTSWYVVSFRTATTGTIARVEMTFPSGFDISQVRRIDNVGIPDGTMSASGQTAIYTVTAPGAVPLNTLVKIMMERIVNPNSAALNQIAVTTRDGSNAIIDGPTNSATFVLTPISSEMTDFLPNNAPVVNAGIDQQAVGTRSTVGAAYYLTCNFALSGRVTDDVFSGFLTHEWVGSAPPAFAYENPDELSTNVVFTSSSFAPITLPVATQATLTGDDGIIVSSDSVTLTCQPPG